MAVDAFGGLDTLVNNVALSGGSGSPASLSLDTWDQVMRVNLRAPLLTTRHSAPHLIAAESGSILNISSIAAIRGFGSGAYAASKSALLGLTRDWAYLLGRDGIRVNCILPGHVFTPMGDQGGEEVREQSSSGRPTPHRRRGLGCRLAGCLLGLGREALDYRHRAPRRCRHDRSRLHGLSQTLNERR